MGREKSLVPTRDRSRDSDSPARQEDKGCGESVNVKERISAHPGERERHRRDDPKYTLSPSEHISLSRIHQNNDSLVAPRSMVIGKTRFGLYLKKNTREKGETYNISFDICR